MKIKLNLLPEKRIKEIKKKNILRFIVWQEVVIIIIAILFFVMVRGIDAVIELQSDGLRQEISSQEEGEGYNKINKYESTFRSINKKVGLIEKIQQNDINWLNIFDNINKAIPEGVTIESLKNDNYKISISGIAKTRKQLIVLKNNFVKTECFTKVDVPLNDIVLKNDIDFQLDFEVSKKCLLNYEK